MNLERFGVTADMTVTYDKRHDLVAFSPKTVAGDRLLGTYPIYDGGDLIVSTDLAKGIFEEIKQANLTTVEVMKGSAYHVHEEDATAEDA